MKQSPSLARREGPLLFSAPMVRATLAGIKTMTRRVVKPQPEADHDGEPYWFIGGYRAWAHRPTPPIPLRAGGNPLTCPYGQRGDHIWGRETFYAWGRWETRFSQKKGRDEWHFVDLTLECGHAYRYAADEEMAASRRQTGSVRWWKRPAIFMPRAASRILLEIVEVWIERLGAITDADCIAEGAPGGHGSIPGYAYAATPSEDFKHIWTSINGDDSWDPSTFVWVISFRRVPAHTGGQP